MRTPLFLLFLSAAGAWASVTFVGQTWTLPLVVSLLSAIAAFLIVLKGALFGVRGVEGSARPTAKREKKSARKSAAKAAPKPATSRRKSPRKAPHVVIDGSNVMHWNGEVPRLATLRDVIAALRVQGYQTGIIFDANAGYKLGDRYLDDRDFAKLLNMANEHVLVVPKGEPADSTILAAAREMDAKIITNDQFRDWAGDFPEVADRGKLVQGGYQDGALWLDEEALKTVAFEVAA